jgi:hypothetical protein
MNDLEKIDLLTKRWAELFANMKRLERDNIKNKKRADQLQKEKDMSRTEATKQTGLKEKLEKLCRELQKENNKLKNEQRTLKDAHDKLRKDGDNRFDMVLKALDGHQEDKDNPRKQVLNTKVEDLYVYPMRSPRYANSRTSTNPTSLDSKPASSRSSISTSCASCTSTR